MARSMETYEVHVFRPSGMRLTVLSYTCTNAQVALRRAKKQVYKMGRLAHFYKFVPKLAATPVVGGGL